MNFKCWIGKDGYLFDEVEKLKSLLYQPINLILSPLPSPDFDWILSPQPRQGTFPESIGNIALQTSGTTGEPKVIWKNIQEVIANKRGHGTKEDIWLLTYNPARWAGLSVLIHTIKTGASLVVPNSLNSRDILDKIVQATHVSLTPSLFRKLMLSDYAKLQQAPIKQITFGGEYATQKVLDEAKKLYPNAKITHIYATTETGDICSCSDGLEGFPADKFKLSFGDDMWEQKGNRFYFMGRHSEVINIGGAKITQSEIESATYKIDGIKQCRAYSITNQLLGQVVGLDYVGDVSIIDIKKTLLQTLPKYAVPVKINKVASIELTTANKIKR